MQAPRQGMFWVAVGGVSLIAMTLFNIAADTVQIPGLHKWNNYVTRRNG